MNLHNHNIKIINFATADTVTYTLIKLIGTIEYEENNVCQTDNKTVYLKLNNIDYNQTQVLKNKFKILAELNEGENSLHLTYCCESISLTLKYFPRKTTHAVQPLYIICEGHDGHFQAPPSENNSIESACQRITLSSKLLQCATAEKLFENKLGRKTFYLANTCQVYHSSLNYLQAAKMNQEELWQHLAREIMNSDIGDDKIKYLGFLSCTRYCGEKYTEAITTHEELVKITETYVAMGGGGLALFGTACLYTWPKSFKDIINCFENTTPVDRAQFLDDSCYRGTQGFCFSTTLGSVLHELYHTFDLGHTENGIMGRGFDNIYKVFTVNVNDTKPNFQTKTFQSNIEFKEEFESEKLSERLEKENMKKEFNVTQKFEEADDTYLTKSCAVLLSYHKWFNNEAKENKLMSFDLTNKCIKSTTGIRVVELRDEENEMVLSNWTFEGKVLKFSFQIPTEVLTEFCNKKLILVVEDTIGSIIKEKI